MHGQKKNQMFIKSFYNFRMQIEKSLYHPGSALLLFVYCVLCKCVETLTNSITHTGTSGCVCFFHSL